MIALHFPETFLAVVERMYTDHYQKDHRSRCRDHQTTFVSIQIGTTTTTTSSSSSGSRQVVNNKLNFSSMKFFDRFRKIVMRLLFSIPSSSSSSRGGNRAVSGAAAQRRRSCDLPETPKSSCSSSYYYSSNSHYHEAIADCIDFFNKSSSQEGTCGGRRSDVVV